MAAGEGEGSGMENWARWQVVVCAAIVAVPAAAAVAVIGRARRERPLRSADLWAPCWRGAHPLWLLLYRCLVFVAMAWLLFRAVLVDGAWAFFFYTQWTFTLVIVYFAIATLISAHGCWVYSRQHITENDETNLFLKRDIEQNSPATLTYKAPISFQGHHLQQVDEKRAGFWGHTMQIIYQTSAGAVMLTDVVFWGILIPFFYSEHFNLSAVMIGMHSLNAVFLLLDTAVNNLPFPWFGMAYFVLWSCIYVTFQWVLHACGFSWWPYPFLELSTPWAPLWYFCMALVHIPCYVVYWLIVKAKNLLFPKLFPHAYVRSY